LKLFVPLRKVIGQAKKQMAGCMGRPTAHCNLRTYWRLGSLYQVNTLSCQAIFAPVLKETVFPDLFADTELLIGADSSYLHG
jgi:hypothetical protein